MITSAKEVEKLAKRKFPTSKFTLNRNVICFAEHSTTDSEGKQQQYDRQALELIAEKCNQRILDTDDYAVLSGGHTPDRDEVVKGAKMPEVLGFVGNFRVGEMGRKNKKFAIYCDEYIYRDRTKDVQRLPRRSVELWQAEDMKDRFFDPVAALGAETPRLDLGVRFAKLGNVTVEKYTAVAPGSGNVFIPDDNLGPKAPAEPEAYAMQDADIQQITDAIMQTDVMQWASAQMAADTAPAADDMSAPEELGAPDEFGAPDDMGAPPEMGGEPPMPEAPPAAPDMGGAPEEEPEEYACDDEDEEDAETYESPDPAPQNATGANMADSNDSAVSAGGAAHTIGSKKFSRSKERSQAIRYRKMEDQVVALTKDRDVIRAKFSRLEGAKRFSDRKAELQRLRMEEGLTFNIDKAEQRAAKYSASRWDDYLDDLAENCRSPIGVQLAIPPSDAPPETDSEKFSREKSANVRKYALAHGMKYDEAEAAIEADKAKTA